MKKEIKNDPIVYKSADFFMFRFAHFPLQIAETLYLSENLFEKVFELYHDSPLFQEAISIASSDLHEALRQQLDSEKRKKIAPSLFKYLLRMMSRTTPFGLFASVCHGNFSRNSQINLDFSLLSKKVQPNLQWFSSLDIQSHKKLIRQLHVQANPQIFFRSDRAVLFMITDLFLRKNYSSIRNTPALEAIMSLAKQPVAFEALENNLFNMFPNSPKDKISEYLWDLLNKKFLLSEISHSVYSADVIQEFIEKIKPFEKTTDLINALEKLRKNINEYEQAPIGGGIHLFEKISHAMNPLKQIKSPLRIDTIYKGQDISLNSKVQEVVEEAASLLWRLSNQIENPPSPLLNIFLEKYGTDRLIPIRDLISDSLFQEMLLSSKESSDPPSSFESSVFKFNYISLKEISLDSIIPSLPLPSIEKWSSAPPSLELYFKIAAPSLESIDRGNFSILITGASTQAGATFGRFLKLFSEEFNDHFREFINKEELSFPDLAFVEASFLPEYAKSQNICFCQSLRSYKLSMDYNTEHSSFIDLDDVYVGATNSYLYAYSKTLGKELRITLNSLINPELAPIGLKLLLNISNNRFSDFSTDPWSRFRFGSFMPRIKYKNIIFSPSRWYFNYEILQLRPESSEEEISTSLLQHIEEYQVHNEVYLSHFDNQILINWRRQECFSLILKHFMAEKSIVLTENVIPVTDHIMKTQEGNYVSEFVVPFIKLPIDHKKEMQRPTIEDIASEYRIFVPGSEWLCTKIYLPNEETEGFIQSLLIPFMTGLSAKYPIKKWFYVRYKDEKFHIRLRLNASPDIIASSILSEFELFFGNLLRQRGIEDFLLFSYEKEIERYGGIRCIEMAEDFFYRDSVACGYLLSNLQLLNTVFPIHAIASFGIMSILHHFNYLPVLAEESKHLLAGSRIFSNPLINYARQLLFLSGKEKSDSAVFNILLHSYGIFKDSLLFYASLIQNILVDESRKEHLINSLIHMHCNRLMGPFKNLELKARATALYALGRIKIHSNSLQKGEA